MRCLALAQGWRAMGGEAQFVMSEPIASLMNRLTAEGIGAVELIGDAPGSLADADEAVRVYQRQGAELLAVDGYHFGAQYQERLKQHDVRLLAFDDYGHAGSYAADFVLNQTNCASEGLYARRASYTRLLLGTDYTVLRREFWPYADFVREHTARATRILVTLGGADPDNVTAKVLSGLTQLRSRNIEVTIVAGSANVHREALADQLAASGLAGRLLTNVSDMPLLMAWADLAVTAGGSTVWELALLEVPCVSVILADNQAPCLDELHARGAVLNLGWHHQASAAAFAAAIESLAHDRLLRVEMASRLQRYIDGRGLDRVLGIVRQASWERQAA